MSTRTTITCDQCGGECTGARIRVETRNAPPPAAAADICSPKCLRDFGEQAVRACESERTPPPVTTSRRRTARR